MAKHRRGAKDAPAGAGKFGLIRESSGGRGRKFRTCLGLYVSLRRLSSKKCQSGHFSFVIGHTARRHNWAGSAFFGKKRTPASIAIEYALSCRAIFTR